MGIIRRPRRWRRSRPGRRARGCRLRGHAGEVVELELELEADAHAQLLGTCDADGAGEAVAVGTRPLQVGELRFAAPVLAAACAGDGSSVRLTLHEAGDACQDDPCLHFADPGDSDAWLPGARALAAAPETAAVGDCLSSGTRDCVSCGGGQYRPRTITSVLWSPQDQKCIYQYSYGTCSFNCEF